MEDVMQVIQPVLDFFAAGFNQVNAIQGIIIAVIAAFILGEYRRILVIALGATIVHVIVDTVIPVIQGAPVKLPPLADGSWWQYVATLFVGYIIIITVFYILKRMFVRS